MFTGLRIQNCLFTLGFGVVDGAPDDIMRTRYDVNKKNIRNISTDAFYDRGGTFRQTCFPNDGAPNRRNANLASNNDFFGILGP